MAEIKAPRSGPRASRRVLDGTAEAALRGLETDGVPFGPHRDDIGVAPLEELLDLYATRGLLEEQAARLAARHIEQSDLAELERISHAMQAPLLTRSADEITRLSRDFHRCIYRAARRPHLLLLIEQLWDATAEQDASLFGARTPNTNETVFLIRSLVAACRARDASALGMLVRYENHQSAAAALEGARELPVSEAPPASKRQRTLRSVEVPSELARAAARLA